MDSRHYDNVLSVCRLQSVSFRNKSDPSLRGTQTVTAICDICDNTRNQCLYTRTYETHQRPPLRFFTLTSWSHSFFAGDINQAPISVITTSSIHITSAFFVAGRFVDLYSYHNETDLVKSMEDYFIKFYQPGLMLVPCRVNFSQTPLVAILHMSRKAVSVMVLPPIDSQKRSCN